MTLVRPFRCAVPREDLDDLRRRVRATRWPEPVPRGAEGQGLPLDYLLDVANHWAERWDWSRAETSLNAWPQVMVEVDGLDVHVLHARSPHPDAVPLVLTHGWPGSVLEYLSLLPRLTDSSDVPFHVVVPSLPGYGFSGRPTASGWGVRRTADAWASVMAALGYERFGAHGTDWGTSVTTALGQQHPDRLIGIHVCPPIAPPDPATAADLTEAERRAQVDLRAAQRAGSGYTEAQAREPQNLGYGLTDSPIGLCAWILQRYWSWVDHDGDLEAVVPRDTLLDVVALYWLTRSAASSARLYWESIDEVARWFTDDVTDRVDVPTGATVYPHDVPRPSRRWAARRYRDIRYWGEPERGGHFPALEQPDSLAHELRAFFALVR